MAFKGFAQNLLSGEAFSQIEAELESAVKDKETTGPSPPPPDEDGDPLVPASVEAAPAALAPTSASDDGNNKGAGVGGAKLDARLAKLEAKLAEKTELCAEKDVQIAAVLEEGERLSVRQAEQEKLIRKLKTQAREAQETTDDLATELEETKATLGVATRTLSEQESAVAGQTAEMRAVAHAASSAREAEREAERTDYDSLRIKHEALAEDHRNLSLQVAQPAQLLLSGKARLGLACHLSGPPRPLPTLWSHVAPPSLWTHGASPVWALADDC